MVNLMWDGRIKEVVQDSKLQPISDIQSLSAESTHATWRLFSGRDALFCKIDTVAERIINEVSGLAELAKTDCVRVPKPVSSGKLSDGSGYLVLEWLDLKPGDTLAAERLGRELAQLHCNTGDQYGLAHDNHIGLSEQKNHWSDDWVEFYRDYRLVPQLRTHRIETTAPEILKLGLTLCEYLHVFFDSGEAIEVSPLHGDLWSGNWGVIEQHEPVIFDPAFYWGHAETDLAMTELFGGFQSSFYQAYYEIRPLSEGYTQRQPLYQLYHVLNHYNLFGGSYGSQSLSLLKTLSSFL